MNKKLSILFALLLSACGGSKKTTFVPGGNGDSEIININDILPSGKVSEKNLFTFLEKQIKYEKEHLTKSTIYSSGYGSVTSGTTNVYNNRYSHVVSETITTTETYNSDTWFHATDDFKSVYQYDTKTQEVYNTGINMEEEGERLFLSSYCQMPGILIDYQLSLDSVVIKSITRVKKTLTIDFLVGIAVSESQNGYDCTFECTLDEKGHIIKVSVFTNLNEAVSELTFTYGLKQDAPSDIVNSFEKYIKGLSREDFYVEVDKSVADKNIRAQKTNKENDEVFTHDGCAFDGVFELTTAEWVEKGIKTSMVPGFIINGQENAEFLGYRLYLFNQNDEDVTIYPTVVFDGGNNPDWLIQISRILIQTQLVGHDEKSNRYFGDESKPISTYVLEEGNKQPIFTSSGNDGYCVPYSDTHIGGNLVEDSYVIPAHEALDLAFAFYFEGEDSYATNEYFASDASIKFSLHISA